ncbi:MAG: gamma-glutamyltransferase [Acidobacteria bacterium]|nr:gamma-glutamyltransferase [Acidobacteriota bacterium]
MTTTARSRLALGLLLMTSLPLTSHLDAQGQERSQFAPDYDPRASLRAHRPAVPGTRALVTSAHPLASMAGMDILMKGGNAFDAAVAVAATLNLVEPMSSGFGGNGFMTVYHRASGKVLSLSMAGPAPRGVVPAEMTPALLDRGIKAGIVPGNAGGLLTALERFGTKSLAEVLAPAIGYAERGVPINQNVVSSIRSAQGYFANVPTSAAVFLPGGRVPKEGELFRMPDLARTFRRLVEAEAQAQKAGKPRAAAIRAAYDRFYTGDIAKEIAEFARANGGLLTAEDIASFRPEWTEPLHTTYRGFDVYSNPSTSRGGFEVAMQLNLVESFDLKGMGAGSAAATHVMAEAIKVAKADIYRYVADPRSYAVPQAGLLSKEYAASRRGLIDPVRAGAYPAAGAPAGAPPTSRAARGPVLDERYERSYDTTSFSIIDAEGNAVACTPTLGGNFGNMVVMGGTGLLLNNGMRLGSTSPYPDNPNYVAPGRIPILNNAPVIVMKDGRLKLVFGTPGGETIGQTQFQVLVNVLDFGMGIQEAIEAPRFRVDAEPSFYKPGAAMTLALEARLPTAVLDRLKGMGHAVEMLPAFTAGVGGVQGVLFDLDAGTMTAGADPRRAGYAVGW